MIQLPVYNRQGQEVGTVEVDEADFGGTIRHAVLRDALLAYEAAQRVGSASTLSRSEMRYAGTKPWRQKGTGRARAGSRGSPIWRGGAVAFGPKPRDYRHAMPRKALRAATRSAYLAKLQGGTTVVDELTAEAPRTRDLAATLAALGIERSCLIAIEGYDGNLWKSARNIPRVAMKPVSEINAHDLLRHHRLLITQGALAKLVGLMHKTARAAATDGDHAPEEQAGADATE